ncbi:hypothetical protein [Ferruginivarius sediminum]|uniref:Uncharacterized protein n=1 Tax=Ferruginivarius sediminum TaxID=2661937 RepID=A0A369TAG6_9PROT|nr:hypothetical protein [Ferruginivarius sediminum]RDD62321.1 hypothetical protein DRB17_08825 [Ferruginivarius sediminum]
MKRAMLLAPLMAVMMATGAAAEPTPITVHVISKDAKFIGSSMGGVRVTLSDADTGEQLAEGRTAGATGDTAHIMEAAHKRGAPLSEGGAAKFEASIDIDEPTLVRVTAFGPLGQRQSANEVSATQWVLPGKGITGGDGWLLEMPGFNVDVLAPPAHVKLKGLPQTINLHANVTMMCGCPIAPGDLWDADSYEIAALVYRDGELLGEKPLAFAGSASQFTTDLTVDEPGVYEVAVYARDKGNGNTGLDKVTFVVSPQ